MAPLKKVFSKTYWGSINALSSAGILVLGRLLAARERRVRC
jgi:hypothetical protein